MFLRSKHEAKSLKLDERFIRKVLQPSKPTEVFTILSRSARSSPRRRHIDADRNSLVGEMMEKITEQRLFRDADLEEMLENTKEEHPELEGSQVEKAYLQLRKELDK